MKGKEDWKSHIVGNRAEISFVDAENIHAAMSDEEKQQIEDGIDKVLADKGDIAGTAWDHTK